jgi:manganese transport protein
MASVSAEPVLSGTAARLEARGSAAPRRALAGFIAPAMLVSVGYMDPGNWATDVEGGARFGYQLLWVLVLSNAIAWLLQSLSVKLGTTCGLDLASACRTYYSKGVATWLWILAEIAIIACDLAEVLGSAVALNLLFHVPMVLGAALTVADVLLIFELQRRAHLVERFVGASLLVITVCLGLELFMAKPDLGSAAAGLVPRLSGESLYLAIGILGATVMPHNLYLHSALAPRVRADAPAAEYQRALRAGTVSTGVALNTALLLNAGILLLAAAVFSTRGIVVSDLRDAHRLLTPLVGTGLASFLFAVGLLCSGQTSTITGTLAGQIVMEGFLNWRVSPVARRLLTRGLALIPTISVLALVGPSGTMPLLVASQVVLSLQLPFAVVPLLRLTNSPNVMGRFANSSRVRVAAGACAALVVVVNAALVLRTAREWHEHSPVLAYSFGAAALAGLGFLAWVSRVPLCTVELKSRALAGERNDAQSGKSRTVTASIVH